MNDDATRSDTPEVRYRVVCLTCREGTDLPLYEGDDMTAARRFFASGLRRQDHDMRLQQTVIEWADVASSSDDTAPPAAPPPQATP